MDASYQNYSTFYSNFLSILQSVSYLFDISWIIFRNCVNVEVLVVSRATATNYTHGVNIPTIVPFPNLKRFIFVHFPIDSTQNDPPLLFNIIGPTGEETQMDTFWSNWVSRRSCHVFRPSHSGQCPENVKTTTRTQKICPERLRPDFTGQPQKFSGLPDC